MGLRNPFKLIIILAYVESHIHSPSHPLEPHTFLKGRKKPFNFTFLEAEQLSVPCQLLKSVPSPLLVFSSQGRNECTSTGTERERKNYFWEKKKSVSLFPAFCNRYFFMRTSKGKGESVYEMEAGLYQKLLLMSVVVAFQGAQRSLCCCGYTSAQGLLCSPIGFLGLCPTTAFPSGKGLSSPTSKYLLLAKLNLPGDASKLRNYLYGPV